MEKKSNFLNELNIRTEPIKDGSILGPEEIAQRAAGILIEQFKNASFDDIKTIFMSEEKEDASTKQNAAAESEEVETKVQEDTPSIILGNREYIEKQSNDTFKATYTTELENRYIDPSEYDSRLWDEYTSSDKSYNLLQIIDNNIKAFETLYASGTHPNIMGFLAEQICESSLKFLCMYRKGYELHDYSNEYLNIDTPATHDMEVLCDYFEKTTNLPVKADVKISDATETGSRFDNITGWDKQGLRARMKKTGTYETSGRYTDVDLAHLYTQEEADAHHMLISEVKAFVCNAMIALEEIKEKEAAGEEIKLNSYFSTRKTLENAQKEEILLQKYNNMMNSDSIPSNPKEYAVDGGTNYEGKPFIMTKDNMYDTRAIKNHFGDVTALDNDAMIIKAIASGIYARVGKMQIMDCQEMTRREHYIPYIKQVANYLYRPISQSVEDYAFECVISDACPWKMSEQDKDETLIFLNRPDKASQKKFSAMFNPESYYEKQVEKDEASQKTLDILEKMKEGEDWTEELEK